MNLETPLTSHAPSEEDSTRPTTPSSAAAQPSSQSQLAERNKIPPRGAGLPFQVIPVIPNITFASKGPKQTSISVASEATKAAESADEQHLVVTDDVSNHDNVQSTPMVPQPITSPMLPLPKLPPKSWADLVRTKAPLNHHDAESFNGNAVVSLDGSFSPKVDSLAVALKSYKADEASEKSKISFLEPRGLVNTGNMCYMNSVSHTPPVMVHRRDG